MRGVRTGLLTLAVVAAELIVPVGFAAETEQAADVVSAESDARFLADFDGNGFRYLAVGVPEEDLGPAVNAAYPTRTRAALNEAETRDAFGFSLAAANSAKSAHADLAIGVPDEAIGRSPRAASGVHVIYGSPSGLTGTGSLFWTQDSTGILDEAELDDLFGLSLAGAN